MLFTSSAASAETVAPFSDFGIVPAGRALYYSFTAYNATTLTVPDIQVTVKTTGAVNLAPYLYCNPSWKSKEIRADPGPSNAIYRSEENVFDNSIYIASDSDETRPPGLRKTQQAGYRSFVPGYNCSVVSNDPYIATRIQITVAYNYRTIKMIQPEQDAMQLIWNQCCAAEINASTIQAVETSDATDPNSAANQFKCGRWSAINNLYGGDPKVPFVDFCQVVGNQCTPQGRLYKLDFSSFGLVCPFPQKQIAQFDQLQSLDMSDNFEITGNIADIFSTVQNFPNLQLLDLSDNNGIVGPLLTPGVPAAQASLCRLVANRLVVLNIAEVGVQNVPLPSCLFDDNSKIQELRIEFNRLAGTIPNIFSANSNLRVLTALSCGLGGAIPSSMGLAPQLEVLDLSYNALSGSIPETLGSSTSLRYVALTANQLTGGIPVSLARHPSLQSLDVSNNKLGVLPPIWSAPMKPGDFRATPLRNLQLSQNIFMGSFPRALLQYPGLTLLQMANNKLMGELPTAPGMFRVLRVFNVSGNSLVGTVPDAYNASGVFVLPQLNALGVNQQDPLLASKAQQGATLSAQPQIFDISNNLLSGTVPSFLLANNVPVYVQPYVNIKGNKFTVQCDGSAPPNQLAYMAQAQHLCPQSPPAGALQSLSQATASSEATTAQPTGQQADAAIADSSNRSSSSSNRSSRLPTYGIALITVIIVLAILGVIAWVGVTYYRAHARGEPFTAGLLLPSRSHRMKQFNDLEMTSGMDPLGFGSDTTNGSNANAQMLGNGESSNPLKSNGRSKGGFL